MADSENDVLYVIDYNGKLIEVVGQTGNAPLEFLHPTGIAEYKNNIYVLDAKNWRIQILYENLTYLDEIDIELPVSVSKNNWVLSSIAVDEEGNIYMGSLDERYPYIICFHRSDNEFINLGQNFCGTVSEEAGKIYAINMGLVTEDKKTGIGIRTGKNYLYHVTVSGLEIICELPYGITATGFTVKEDGLYCVSGSYHAVDFYDFNGKYKYSIVSLEEIDRISSLSKSSKGDIYLGLPNARKVYRINYDDRKVTKHAALDEEG